MTLGKITCTILYDHNICFDGMFITAEYVNQLGLPAKINFKYNRFTTNLKGRVESVIDSQWKRLPVPKHVTNVTVE